MAMVGQANITTFPDGTKPKLKKLGFDNYQCPFCEKVGPYHNLVPHLQSYHQRSSVKHGGYNVYKCHLHCVAKGHYHCAFCLKILMRKSTFINHIKKCLCQQQAMAVTVPSTETRDPSAETRGPSAETRDPSAETRDSSAETRDSSAETRGPSAETRDSSAETRGPSAETRGPSAETRGPSAETRGPSAETRGPSAETRGPSAETRDPSAETRGASAETRGPSAETRGPSAETRGPSAETRDPSAETRGPSAETRGASAETRGASAETRGASAETRGPSAETRGPSAETRGPPAETRDLPMETSGPSAETSGPSAETRGPSAETRDPSAETRGPSAETSGPSAETRGPSAETSGPSAETRGPAATLPAIKTIITTFPDGTKPNLKKLGFDNYQCPFCERVGPYHNLVPHLQSHQWSTVKYGGYSVYKCYLACEAKSHYHCGFCIKSIIRKDTFINHFKKCLGQQQAMAVTVPPAVPTETRGPLVLPEETRGPHLETSGPSSETRCLPVLPAEKRGPPAETRGPPAKMRGPPAETNGQPNKILLSKCKKTRCSFCNLVMHKKNLKVHIHRHHSTKMPNISIDHYLQSVCVDKKRGIFAVLKMFNGPAHYIHVQKCTWGEERRITCQLDACNRLYDYARRSGQISFECQHIQSLMFSPVPTDLPIFLDEDILAEMVINKWFSKSTERGCLRRKFAADADGALLSYEVNLVQEEGQHFFSVFEPRISSCSRLGRLMVHYNGVLNTWHCPCKKARKSCPHKAIAMWHMYQLKPDVFISSENFHEDLPETFLAVTDPSVDTEAGNIPLYTTEGEEHMLIVDYII